MRSQSIGHVVPSRTQLDTRGLNASLVLAVWWLCVVSAGLALIVFGPYFLPSKFGSDSVVYLRLANSWDLWDGISFDSYVNTARFWAAVMMLTPYEVAIPLYYCGVVALTIRLCELFRVYDVRYQLLAGGWMLCAALMLGLPNKEIIALPVALWLCLASSVRMQWLATLLFAAYTVFYRQYWGITYFYYACTLVALRYHVRGQPRLAVAIVALAFIVPFVGADLLGLPPLTDSRMAVNAERVDSPDARTAFDNPLPNTGFVTDIANAVSAWAYMNVPLALLALAGPQHVAFILVQLCTFYFFAAGLVAFLQDSRRAGEIRSPLHLRCAAFVIAYSLTQSTFEPDFGSFLRHEVLSIIPALVVAFYRVRAGRAEPAGTRLPLPRRAHVRRSRG